MKAIRGFLVTAVLVLLITGCGGGARYQLIESGPQRPTVPARVVVTDLEDERSFDTKLASLSKAAPFTIAKSYHISRPDETFTNVETFPSLFAKNLAGNLQQGGHFAEVSYAAPDEMPPVGTYDLLLTGTLKETTAAGHAYFYGLVLPFGFRFSDVVWFLGAPQLTRRYDLAMDLQLYDGRTGQPIGEPIDVQYRTDGKIFTTYANETKLDDLHKKIVGIWNEYIEELHAEYPTGDEQYWANLRTEGEEYLRAQAREQEFIRKGSPPVITFISPTGDTRVRDSDTTIRWSVTAPNGLKSLAMAANNEQIETGVRSVELADPDAAPRGVSATDSVAALDMGRNLIEAVATDHRGNRTAAELIIYRLPRSLRPEQRYALVVGMGSSAATDTAEEIESVLTDPAFGQFPENAVTMLTGDDFDPAQLTAAIREFGPRAKAGELALVYIAVPGNLATDALGAAGNTIPLQNIVQTLRRSLATEEVVLVFDIDWSSNDSSKEVLQMLGELPTRWAVAVSSNTPAPAQNEGGELLFGSTLAGILSGDNVDADNVTLERLMDLMVERGAEGPAEPEVTGRFNPNITMAEFE